MTDRGREIRGYLGFKGIRVLNWGESVTYRLVEKGAGKVVCRLESRSAERMEGIGLPMPYQSEERDHRRKDIPGPRRGEVATKHPKEIGIEKDIRAC